MTAHTPAPWDDSTGHLLGADRTPVGVQQYNVSLPEQLERIRADRKLMRAAPELLAALLAIVKLSDDLDPERLFQSVEYINARAAIDKATG